MVCFFFVLSLTFLCVFPIFIYLQFNTENDKLINYNGFVLSLFTGHLYVQ